ncbi:MAG: hypothetical protein II537_02705, partial [Bacteroidales bacterium]|nr:hypothetical protein [Bacteroidales bacterium]
VIKMNEESLCAVNQGVIKSMNAETVLPGNPFGGKVAITAHRGFWNCEAAGFSENSIAALAAAQKAGVWGSEFDVQLTKDDVAIVNHNDAIEGVAIADALYADLLPYKLPNGESRPTLDAYLAQGAKAKTMLVMELKPQRNIEREDILVDKAIAALQANGLFDPSRVMFISFSWHICRRIAALAPQFSNQFLEGNYDPKRLLDNRINGFDYEYPVILAHKDWVKKAHENGMTVNTWTVDKAEDMKAVAEAGVDVITTNAPLLARQILEEKEYK